ncbi:hypothetical protein BDD12DRAFT_547112 [Trichophaea hybrida]|nr:hypothetical protein BDD12DRAFT_547112 [Trichophaea hybrida]
MLDLRDKAEKAGFRHFFGNHGLRIGHWRVCSIFDQVSSVPKGNDLISDDEQNESEDELLQSRPSYGQGLVRHIMRGVIRCRNARCNITMKLDPRFRKRGFDIFGHNGLTISDLQDLCPTRRNPRVSQGGTAGRTAEGTFSIVASSLVDLNITIEIQVLNSTVQARIEKPLGWRYRCPVDEWCPWFPLRCNIQSHQYRRR